MPTKLPRAFFLAVSLLAFAGCTPVQTKDDDAPPPPQNLLGSTDELQLVTELSFDLAAKYGGDRVLIVLEVDATLLAVEQGSECPGGEMQPVQEDASKQVRRMQDAGLKVIALASHGPGCRTQILQELHRNGFGFQASAWPPQSGYAEPFLPEGGISPVIYEDGVLLTAGQDEGLVLKALLEKSGDSNPALIVMVAHRQADLNAVIKSFAWTGIKVHAWQYTREAGVAPNH
jgi:hypothetical protein